MLHKTFINIAICLVVYMSLGTSVTAQACSSPWVAVGGKCLLFTSFQGNWTHMNGECAKEGGQLIKLDNQQLFDAVWNNISHTGNDYWIELSYQATEDTFLDGEEFSADYSLWAPGQPDNLSGTEDCVELVASWGGYKLNHQNCQSSKRAICEK